MARSAEDPVYGIGAVAKMLGTNPGTLRAWEERYGVVVPARSAGAQRLYSRDQVAQLKYAQNLVESGLHAADAHRLLAQRLEDGMTMVPPSSEAAPASVSILLAERDIYAAELVEYLLRTEGYEVLVALDANDAMRLFEARAPALVVVELVASGGSGMQLCRDLRQAGATVVAVSALAIGDAAIEAGAEAFLRKPLDHLQMVSTVKDLVGSSRLTHRYPQPKRT